MKILFLSTVLAISFFYPINSPFANEASTLEFEINTACAFLNSCGKLLSFEGERSIKITQALLKAPSPMQEGLYSFFKSINHRTNSLENTLLARKNIIDNFKNGQQFGPNHINDIPAYVRHNTDRIKNMKAALIEAHVDSYSIANLMMLEDSLPFSEYIKNHALKDFLKDHVKTTQSSMFQRVRQFDPNLIEEIYQLFMQKSTSSNELFKAMIHRGRGKPKGNTTLYEETKKWTNYNRMKGSATVGAIALTGSLATIAVPGVADYYQKSAVAEDCQTQFNLSQEEVDYLKEHMTVLETMGAEGCQLAFTPIDFYSNLESENKLSPGLKKMMVAKTNELKARTNIDLKYESSKNNVCESADIYDGTKKLATVIGSDNGPKKISIIENNIAYQVSLKKIPELTFMNFSLECLKANGEKDGVCTANLQSYLGSFGRGGTGPTVNGADYFVNQFKDPIAFKQLCAKNSYNFSKDKKVACDYLSRVERLQVALAGLDVLCKNYSFSN